VRENRKGLKIVGFPNPFRLTLIIPFQEEMRKIDRFTLETKRKLRDFLENSPDTPLFLMEISLFSFYKRE